MGKKPGFQVKMGGETFLYIIILILIFAFVFFMPNIYKVISNFKIGKLFGNNVVNTDENNSQNTQIENEEDDSDEVTPNLVCTKMESKPEGNLVETYMFYYNDNKLEKVENEKNYDAITDEYLNYVYFEQSKFANLNNLYKDVPGFSYDAKLESRMLVATFTYDMNKLNQDLLYNESEELNIELNVNKNQSLEEVKTTYENLGYECR